MMFQNNCKSLCIFIMGIVLLTRVGASTQVADDDALLCRGCEQFWQSIAWALSGPLPDTIVKFGTGYVCQYTPSPQSCIETFEKLQKLMKELADKFHPLQICQKLRMCPNNESCGAVNAPFTCEACKIAAKELIMVLKEKSTLELVLDTMKRTCNELPEDTLRKVCRDYFDGPFKTWLEFILSVANPDNVCEVLHFCPKVTLLGANNMGCDSCLKVTDGAKELVKSAAFVNNVHKNIDRLCALTFVYSHKCAETAHMMFAELIEKLESSSSKKLCQEMHLCA